MEVVKKVGEYTIVKKRSGRFAVKAANGKFVNKEEKVKILLDAGLITAPAVKVEEPAVEETQEEAVQE
ncbi:hypothetical protein ABMA70_14715 [Halobacteriovorax sp. XZX-3]|uniref:hypothetical protein n=1 Tax=unclassified Halobacteriovorax TaxID=2639665 RepID=UPI000CD2D385|nr:hypothetical protein [Halobacteriovorax sp. DA5]POB13658.1 hypothetical protein C0Z22_08880 [Halobacteriovorax sp. DA5]